MSNDKNENNRKQTDTKLLSKTELFYEIKKEFSSNPCQCDLFCKLGAYYLEQNLNQAYLCFQYALFYCDSEEKKLIIQKQLDELLLQGAIDVRKTSIVIVSYNSCYLLEKTIESIRKTVPSDTYKIIVVDNCSSDDCVSYLKKQPDITLILNSENLGFAHGCNQGCFNEMNNDIYLLNNDTRLAANSLFWLQMGLYENEKIGACGSISNYAGNNQQLDLDFPLPNDYLSFAKTQNILLDCPYEERVRLSGFSMLIRHGAWQQVDGMDEQFSPGYFEDDDLSMKLRSAGYRLLLCHNSFIYHAGSQSFSLRPDIESLLINNHAKFIDKYQFDILSYALPRPEKWQEIPYDVGDAFNLLFIGSELGANCMYLQKIYPHCNIISVETDPNLYRIVQNDLTVFNSIAALFSAIHAPLFHVLCINQSHLNANLEEYKKLDQLCIEGCKLIVY